jgi:hypothetical protein
MFITEYLVKSLSLMFENLEIRRQMVSCMPTAPSTLQNTDVFHGMGNKGEQCHCSSSGKNLLQGLRVWLVKILAIIIVLVRPCVTFVTHCSLKVRSY